MGTSWLLGTRISSATILALFFFAVLPASVQAQSEPQYLLTLNYKESVPIDSLSTIRLKLAETHPSPFIQPEKGYTVEAISSTQEVLHSQQFTIPKGAVMLPGLLEASAVGNEKDLTFTLSIPYSPSVSMLRFYDEEGNLLLTIPIDNEALAYSLPTRTIEGTLEVMLLENFNDLPKVSYAYAVYANGEKYQLSQDLFEGDSLHYSGEPVRVSGRLLGATIFVDSFDVVQKKAPQGTTQNPSKESAQFVFPYALEVGLAVVLFHILLVLFIIYRRTEARPPRKK